MGGYRNFRQGWTYKKLRQRFFQSSTYFTEDLQRLLFIEN